MIKTQGALRVHLDVGCAMRTSNNVLMEARRAGIRGKAKAPPGAKHTMNRRNLMKTLLGLLLAPTADRAVSAAPRRAIRIQESPLAGFQFHDGVAVWSQLRENDALLLVREPENAYDERAVAVYWRDRKLGYVPRDENTAVAWMLDRNVTLSTRIIRLREDRNPWSRIRLGVEMGTA